MFKDHSAETAPTDGPATAESADLTYCSDTEPGITRSGKKVFRYRDARGNQVRDRKTLERIAALAIPPAWTEVWIAPRESCHIQATGRDARGRKQYRYHSRWTACRDEAKFSSLIEFAHALPKIRRKVEHDLNLRGLPREKVIATVVWLLDHAMIRVGNAAYSRDNKSFGLTTLRDRHVDVTGASVKFAFRGKSGKDWLLKITDRRIARIVKGVQDIPGQHLFQYIQADGSRGAIGSQDINAYLREAGSPAISSKHFRTWGGTVAAAGVLAGTETPESKSARKRVLNGAVDQVAGILGNTRTVCRACYIHPTVIAEWEDARLQDNLKRMISRIRRAPKGLDREEAAVLKWLETFRLTSANPAR